MLIYVITDRRLRPDLELEALIDQVAGCGADMIQIREKDLTAAALLRCARRAVKPSSNGADVLVNGRADVALAAGAAGVHLPAAGVPAGAIRKSWGRALQIGVSTHSLQEAREAEAQGADFISFGPVFPTESKRVYGTPAGVSSLSKVVSAVRIPVFAIGGINVSTIGDLAGVPLAGISVVSAVVGHRDMAAATAGLREALR